MFANIHTVVFYAQFVTYLEFVCAVFFLETIFFLKTLYLQFVMSLLNDQVH